MDIPMSKIRTPYFFGHEAQPGQAGELLAVLMRQCAPILLGLPGNLMQNTLTERKGIMRRAVQHLMVPWEGKSAGEKKVMWLPNADYELQPRGGVRLGGSFRGEPFDRSTIAGLHKLDGVSDPARTKSKRIVVYESLESADWMEVAWVHLGAQWERFWEMADKTMPTMLDVVTQELWAEGDVFGFSDVNKIIHSHELQHSDVLSLKLLDGRNVFVCGVPGFQKIVTVYPINLAGLIASGERYHGWRVDIEEFKQQMFPAGTKFFFLE